MTCKALTNACPVLLALSNFLFHVYLSNSQAPGSDTEDGASGDWHPLLTLLPSAPIKDLLPKDFFVCDSKSPPEYSASQIRQNLHLINFPFQIVPRTLYKALRPSL